MDGHEIQPETVQGEGTMNFDQLKQQVKEISDVAQGVPESFRDKCFEILLSRLLDDLEPTRPGGAPTDRPVVEPARTDGSRGGAIPTPSQIRVFMGRTDVTQEELASVLMYEGEEVYFRKDPSPNAVSKGQIEWTLLLALKNAIENNAFTVDPEAVRSVCQDKGYYDKKNFAATFKKAAYAKYFKGTLEPQGEAQPLTNEGQDALAALIKRLSGAGT